MNNQCMNKVKSIMSKKRKSRTKYYLGNCGIKMIRKIVFPEDARIVLLYMKRFFFQLYTTRLKNFPGLIS